MDMAFKRHVEELSKGSIKIDLQCSGILGDEAQVMDLILNSDSSIQLARVSASLAPYGGQKSRLLTIPYTFENDEHFWKFAASPLAEEILSEPYDIALGVRGLFYAEEGFRHFFSTTKISSIKEMKEKKVRVSSSQVLHNLVKSLDATPVTVPFTDLYASMQTGMTDVAEQPLSNYLSNSFYEVAPYVILDGHMLGAVQVVINSNVWDSLTEKQQNILKRSGEYASNYCHQIVTDTNNKALIALKENGVTVTDVPDKKAWQDSCNKMIKESSKDYPYLYEEIRKLKE